MPETVLQLETFLFADVAGFTALTEAHGDRAAAELATDFAASVERLIEDEQSEVIKLAGDGVMVHAASPGEAIRLGRSIVDHLACHGSPPVRVGIHAGTALFVNGDWFGTGVNLASRVADAARPGEVLVSEPLRGLLTEDEAAELDPRGRRYFKGVPNPVKVYSAWRSGGPGHELRIDPVCRMAIDTAKAHSTLKRHGRSYSFCSERCAKAFQANPSRFIAHSRRALQARTVFKRHLETFAIVELGFVVVWLAGVALGATAWPWFLLIAVGWGIPLGLHYRAVRHLL